jgi:ubiquinone/menaquinone biosynthesis C-methylase UbiE
MSHLGDRIRSALIDRSMRNARFDPYRSRIASAAEGRVLEVGIGSGLNLPLYGVKVRHVTGLDPSPGLLARAARRGVRRDLGLDLVEGSAERLPFPDRSFDCVVMTWTGCSIPDIAGAYGEIRRVLRPGGCLVFAEHGRSPGRAAAAFQDLLTPVWCRIAGGCRLNRDFDTLLRHSGFALQRLETGYMPGLRPLAFIYEGVAVPR